jgi:hypothetical protein
MLDMKSKGRWGNGVSAGVFTLLRGSDGKITGANYVK